MQRSLRPRDSDPKSDQKVVTTTTPRTPSRWPLKLTEVQLYFILSCLGTFITQVQATPQSAGSITYSLSGVYKADWFHINSSTGVITTAAQTLDLEVIRLYRRRLNKEFRSLALLQKVVTSAWEFHLSSQFITTTLLDVTGKFATLWPGLYLKAHCIVPQTSSSETSLIVMPLYEEISCQPIHSIKAFKHGFQRAKELTF